MSDVLARTGARPIGDDVAPRGWTSAAKTILGVIGVAISLWLASPILFAGHLEEITANLKSLAILANHGDVASGDSLSPLVSQYHYVTRLGVILLLQAIDRVFGETGDGGFHALMIASWAVVCVASVSIARRWSRIGRLAIVAAIVMTPGVFESAFFYNDNMISTAFALGALALVSRWNHRIVYAIAGSALAFAVLCRPDAAVVGPLFAGICWLDNPQRRALLTRGVAALAGASLVIVAAFASTGVSPLDSLAMSKIFLPPSGLLTRIWMAFYFFGLPTLALLLLYAPADRGAPPLGASETLKWRIVFWYYPILLVVLAMAKLSSEVRYVYPLLTPFVAIQAGAALERLAAELRRSGWKGNLARATAVAVGLVVVAPPMLLTVADGPRTVTGRLWSPLLWQRWQIAQIRSMERVQALVDEIDDAPTTLVLSGHYNDEYFLKLRLLEHGYRPRRAPEVFPGCPDGFSVYAKQDHVVANIRTDNQYGIVPWPHHLVRAVQIRRALDCAALWRADRIVFTAVGASDWGGAPDAALFGPLLRQLQPSESFSQTLSIPFRLLLSPDTPAPASANTPYALRTAELEMLDITSAQLAEINDNAVNALVGSKLSYADVAKIYRPITLHGSAFEAKK